MNDPMRRPRRYSLISRFTVLMLVGLLGIQAVFFGVALHYRYQDQLRMAVYDASRTAFSFYSIFYPLDAATRRELAANLAFPICRLSIADSPDFTQGHTWASCHLAARIKAIAAFTSATENSDFDFEPQALANVEDFQIKWRVYSISNAESRNMRVSDSSFTARVAISFPDDMWLLVDYNSLFHIDDDIFGLLVQFAVQVILQLALAVLVLRLILKPLQNLSEFAQAIDPQNPQKGIDAIPKFGPLEVHQLSEAYKDLLERNKNFTEERFRILASLSHDLRNPLHRIRMQIENEPNLRNPEQLLDSLDELQSMAENAISMARTGKDQEEAVLVDLDWFLETLVGNYLEIHPEQADLLTLNIEETAQAELKPESFRRCVENLLDNALRYGGSARISLGMHNGFAQVIIEDQGQGIPEAYLGRVREPFFRLPYSRDRAVDGTGLGLHIASNCARANNARLSLENLPAGGLRACLLIPCSV